MKIIAGNITNLTDARYFAAWDVDALVYTLEGEIKTHVDKIKEIIDWVEGPKAVLYLDNLSVEERQQLPPDFNVDGMMSNKENLATSLLLCTDQIPDFIESKTLVINRELKKQDIELIGKRTDPLYISYQYNKLEILLDLYKRFDYCGIYVEGGHEEKVGFKSYDELDNLFESLTEEQWA